MSNLNRFATVILPVFALLAGCSTTNYRASDPATPGPDSPHSPPPTVGMAPATKAISITPLSKFTDSWTNTTGEGGDFSGAYTRLMIFSDLADQGGAEAQDLKYQGRGLLARAIWGKEFSVNMAAHITVGSYESTVPLATIGHQSNSDGELWSRVIHHSKSDFPLFLVKNDGSASIPSVKIGVTGTKTYTSRGAATAVQVALGVAKATSVSTPVITHLSEQATKDKARAVDDAISKLFASGIAEEHWSDRDLRFWNVADGKPRGMTVEFNIPQDEESWDSAKRMVGTWTITFDYPRPSIFSDWRICGKASTGVPRCAATREDAVHSVLRGLDAGEVLNYSLLNGGNNLGTVRALLTQQDWYVAAQSALTDPKKSNETANGLCRRIRNEITGIGLNGLDSEIVLWAVILGMPMPPGADFSKADDCKATLNNIADHRKPTSNNLAIAR